MKTFNMRRALEEFPPPGGGTWSQTQAEIDAEQARNRPIIDQDVAAATKPAPIDGDGVEKIDMRPVDLDDYVLAEQDRRAFEPIAMGEAEQDAIAEQNIATEGWLGKKFENITDWLTQREKEVEDGTTSTEDNLAAIRKMREKLIGRPGEVVHDADTITISKYAKWLSIDGKHITDPEQLIRELGRVYDFVKWCDNLDQAWLKAYKYVSDQVWKLGESDLKKAEENLKKMFEVSRPEGADKWLTQTKVVTFKGKEYKDRHSPYFLGQWCLYETIQEEESPVPGGIVEVCRMKSMKAVKGGEFKALTKDQMRRVLDVCEKIEVHLSSSAFEGKIVERYLDVLDEFAYRYRNYKSLSREEQALVSRLYTWGQQLMHHDTTFLPTLYSNHLVKVMLSYVEKSMRRIEVAK